MSRRYAPQPESSVRGALLNRWWAWWRQPDVGFFALAAFLAPLFLYLFTLAPTVTFEDSGEFLTAAYHLGVPHPPGYPLWCLAAHLFTWLPFGNMAQRVHVFDALCGAGTCFVVFLICRRLTLDRWLAVGSAWIMGVSRYLWAQSVIAEVYSLNALLTAIALYAAMEWARTKESRALYTVAIATGLGAANHYLFVLTCPPILLWILCADIRQALRPGRVFLSLGLLILCLSLYLYLPLRASANPPLNAGDPDTATRFIDHIFRTVYSSGDEELRLGTTIWDGVQHARDALLLHTQSLGWIVCAVGILGWITSLRSHRGYAIVTLSILLLNDVALNLLQRERYNVSWAFTHRVYHIPSDLVIVTWFALGLVWIKDALQSSLRLRADIAAILPRLAAASLVLTLLVLNYPHASRRGDDSAARLGREFLEELPKDSVVTALDDFVYVILYLTRVEGFREDVQIFHVSMGLDPSKERKAYFSVVPWSKTAAKASRIIQENSVPAWLGYQIVPYEKAIFDPKSFPTLPKPPATIPPPADPDNIHVHFARGMVAKYYARYAARLFYEGKIEESQAAFQTAEDQASTAYSCYTIAADVYAGLIRALERRIQEEQESSPPNEAKIQNYQAQIQEYQDRQKRLLDRSLFLFRRFHDKAMERFIPLSEEQILDALESLEWTK